MLQNYLKIAWRNLLRHKVFSLINILGLSTGIAACFMIYVYVQHELSFDQYNTKADRIVRVTAHLTGPGTDLNLAGCPIPLGAAIKKDIAGVANTVRFVPTNAVIKHNNEPISESNFYLADASVFDVFSFTFLEGNANGALDKPNTIVLTKSMAKKFFGDGNALGKTLICNDQPWQVTAVVKDRPANSDIRQSCIIANQSQFLNTLVQDALYECWRSPHSPKPAIHECTSIVDMLECFFYGYNFVFFRNGLLHIVPPK